MSYITKTDISYGPQLGSQMTQLGGMYAVHKKTNHQIRFIRNYLNVGRTVKLFDCFDLPFTIVNEEFFRNPIEVKNVLMDSSVFNLNSEKNYDILGAFHTFHYWEDFEDEVKNIFKFKKEIDDRATTFIDSIKSERPLVSLHVRRTDYLSMSSLNLSLNYYCAAMNRAAKECGGCDCVVFSDDINWCKQIFPPDFHFSENNNYVDLCAMTKCDGNIIANSSFSWWGAYLNPNGKFVICPHDYVGKHEKRYEFLNGNYYPDGWIGLEIV